MTIAGNISPTAQDGALLVNTVSVGSDQEDIDLSDNTTTTTTTVQVLKVDLQATKTADADLVVAGEQLTYTITVTNKASTTASGVRVTDSLPINVNFLSDLPRQGSYDSTTNIWTVGTLGPGQSAQLTLEVIVASTTPDGAAPVNTVVAESDQIDDDLSDNTTTTTTTVEMLKVDLEVTNQADVDPVVAGEQLTYTITVTNLALTAATGVRVTEALPTQVSFVSGVTSEGDYDSNTQVWTVGDLGSGQDAQLTLEVLVASTTPDGTVLVNSASATSAQVDLDPSDNTTTTSTNVNVVEIDLAVTKQSSLGSDIPGGEFTYTIGVTNNSQETASGVTVSDSLPSEVALLTSTATRGQYDSGTGLWTVGVLVPGQSETLTLEVRVDAEAFGVITNTAVASSDKPDPQPQNNAATAQVFVLPPPTDQTVQIPMGVGFNLIGLPVRFPAPLTAREFSDLVDAQGGTVAAILRWDAGYEAWLKDFPDQKNFVLEEGRGYFVRLSKSPANTSSA